MAAAPEQLAALKQVVKTVAHLGGDILQASHDPSAVQKLADFSNLLPDLMALLPQMGNIFLTGLAPEDYTALIVELGQDLVIPDAHAAGILNASLNLITAMIGPVKQLMAAINAVPIPEPKV